MKRDLRRLADEQFDVLVIGGGIVGAGVARDASLRGLHVALIDKNDFACGTSSRSSKLIHGGFRYLEQYAFGLVAEGCRERRILQNIAPHLVRPLRLLLPVYEGDRRPLGLMRIGMTLYDLLALFGNTAPHRYIPPEQAIEQEPSLATRGLRGAIRFYDCQEDDARFCVENVLHAADLGAACANYCELTGFVMQGDHPIAARVVDRLGGAGLEVRARLFVNAAGPWVGRVAGLAKADGHLRLAPTKGVHVLLPKLTHDHGICFQGRRDGRIMFVLPWHDCSLVGTTDTDFLGEPDDVPTERADIDYLLDEIRALFPAVQVSDRDIITTTAGLRPLLKSDKHDPSGRSREHQILWHSENLLSVAGGKYTTYRLMAEQVVDQLCQRLGKHRPCRTAHTPLPDHHGAPTGGKLADNPAVYESDISRALLSEMACSVSDVMERRTGLSTSRFGGTDIAARVARIMAPAIEWSESEARASLDEYDSQWKNRLDWR